MTLAIGWAQPRAQAAESKVPPPGQAGGEIQIAWNTTLLNNFQLELGEARQSLGRTTDVFDRFTLAPESKLMPVIAGHSLGGLTGGALYVRGGYDLHAGGSVVTLRNFSFRLRERETDVFDVVTDVGQSLFTADHIMAELGSGGRSVAIRAMDLRVSPTLAHLLEKPEIAGEQVATVRVLTPLRDVAAAPAPEVCPTSLRWPGARVPGHPGETYSADVFLPSLQVQVTGCRNCKGPGGDGVVKFTPITVLRNNVNDTTTEATVFGDPLGTSAVHFSADVPWREMFSASCPPYNNDQHPYLAWNLYRVSPDGRIEQVGRSGVKHSHIAANGQCIVNPLSNHVLGRGCTDAYGTGDNDASGAIGPRAEIIPATGAWGRCGSIYDPHCRGTRDDFKIFDEFEHRLIVHERDITDAVHPGGAYFFEAWYVVRDDVDPYNNMASLPFAPVWYEKSQHWSAEASGAAALGPMIDRWVSPDHPATGELSRELITPYGRVKVAVKTHDLGAGRFRYDYAVMNVDFAIAKTSGTSPNLRIVSSHGVTGIDLALVGGADATALSFTDVDRRAGMAWNGVVDHDHVRWLDHHDNELTWGTLFAFSLESRSAPGPIKLELLANAPHGTTRFVFDSLGPTSAR